MAKNSLAEMKRRYKKLDRISDYPFTEGPYEAKGASIYAHTMGRFSNPENCIAKVLKSVYEPEGSPKIKEWEANAKLFAASYDLYETGDDLLDFYAHNPDKFDKLSKLEQSMIKALGRALSKATEGGS